MFLKVKVRPDSRQEKLIQKSADTYEVHVREPAEDGRANAAVLRLLSEKLKVPAGRLWIVKGARSPSKIIAVKP